MNTERLYNGGCARKSVALSLILSPMKRVQSSPNLATAYWRCFDVTDGLKNGDASSSSLAAKGFRSVRPNLQDKKSPTQVKILEFVYSVTRESVVSGHTSVSSTVPIARFTEEEKKVSVIKAPHYEGIGPVDESGIPIAIRTVRSHNTEQGRCSSCLFNHDIISECN
uniref:SoHo domain-containing protein n=1 Tax=Sphaeramia orbicularis TaxID=375764 RepID=A0A672YLC8_9TELE